jgi:dTMP kinase
MGKLIALEGLDGAGKSTQIRLLLDYFKRKNIETHFVHFPRTAEKTVFGDLVAKFLRGEFGSLESVHPQLVALLFAEDRKDFAKTLKKWLKKPDSVVVMDRYVLSNIAFQGAKLKTEAEKIELSEWILDFEFSYNKIPKPDVSIYLDVPFDFVQHSLAHGREGEDRSYLNGKTDIHEADLGFQAAVKAEYDRMLYSGKMNLKQIICTDATGKMEDAQKIHQQIVELVH